MEHIVIVPDGKAVLTVSEIVQCLAGGGTPETPATSPSSAEEAGSALALGTGILGLRQSPLSLQRCQSSARQLDSLRRHENVSGLNARCQSPWREESDGWLIRGHPNGYHIGMGVHSRHCRTQQ